MLKNGSSGDEVTALQKSLMAMGMNPGTVDGVFGPMTEAAVKQCQERCGVTADGIWGPASQAAFDRMKSGEPAPGSVEALQAEAEAKRDAAPGIQDMLKSGQEAAAEAKPDLPDFA